MSVLTELLITAAIVLSMALQFGVHPASWRRLLGPVAIVAAFAIYYLKIVPTSGGDGLFTLIGLTSGVVLGAIAGTLMNVRRDVSGRIMLAAGFAYIALWIVVFGARLAFAQVATNDPQALRSLFIWAYEHGVTEAGWTAAFMLQAIAMVAVRTVVVVGKMLVTARRPAPRGALSDA